MRTAEWKRAIAAVACLASVSWAIEARSQDYNVVADEQELEAIPEGQPSIRYYVQSTQAEQKPPLPTSDYWIGVVMANPWLPEPTKAQLGLDYGLVVQEAMEGGPAAKAGLKQYDILLKAGEKPLQEPADLIKAVEAAKESTLSLTVYRGGKEQTLDVTPVKREKAQLKPIEASLQANEIRTLGTAPELTIEIQKLEQALNQLKAKAGEHGAEIVFARPAIVTTYQLPKMAEEKFPENLTVRIQKEGDQPAKILVKRGDKEWQTTEDRLDILPDGERRHVLKIFRHGPNADYIARLPVAVGKRAPDGKSESFAIPNIKLRPDGKVHGRIEVRTAPVPPAAPTPPKPPVPPPAPAAREPDAGHADSQALLKQILRKLDENRGEAVEELERQVKELRKELDQLRANKEDNHDKESNGDKED